MVPLSHMTPKITILDYLVIYTCQILFNSYAKLILDVPSGRNDHVHIVLGQFSVPTSSVF